MFQLDSNISAALERQAARVRAVQAYDASGEPATSRSSSLARRLTLGAAAIVPVALLVGWVVFAR